MRALLGRLRAFNHRLDVRGQARVREGERHLEFLARMGRELPFAPYAVVYRQPVALLCREVVALRAEVDDLRRRLDAAGLASSS